MLDAARGPGTGKSHVIKVVKERLFQGLLKWDVGLQFQIVALQAVMADLLGGDTIHHACGIPAFKNGKITAMIYRSTWKLRRGYSNGAS